MSLIRRIPRIVQRYFSGAQTKFSKNDSSLELSFIEEPLGLPQSMGFGYVNWRLGQRIGTSQSFEIVN